MYVVQAVHALRRGLRQANPIRLSHLDDIDRQRQCNGYALGYVVADTHTNVFRSRQLLDDIILQLDKNNFTLEGLMQQPTVEVFWCCRAIFLSVRFRYS